MFYVMYHSILYIVSCYYSVLHFKLFYVITLSCIVLFIYYTQYILEYYIVSCYYTVLQYVSCITLYYIKVYCIYYILYPVFFLSIKLCHGTILYYIFFSFMVCITVYFTWSTHDLPDSPFTRFAQNVPGIAQTFKILLYSICIRNKKIKERYRYTWLCVLCLLKSNPLGPLFRSVFWGVRRQYFAPAPPVLTP